MKQFFHTSGTVEGCLGGEFRCISSHECISIVDVLDGTVQCKDGSDESMISNLRRSIQAPQV